MVPTEIRIHSGRWYPFKRAHDDVLLEQCPKNFRAIAHFHEDEIRRARHERKIHRVEFLLQIGAAFVRDAFRFAAGARRRRGRPARRPGRGH